MAETRSLAVFVDFENLALGFEGRRGTRFEIHKVLERLVEKGKIIVKRAYADWGRFREYRTSLHEAAIELIEIPKRSMTGKNSADIRLVVDAMDLSYSKEHVDTFVIISGDSDFSPLVSKLKENGKHVIGLGMKNSTSDLLIENCDEFIFYEDLDRPAGSTQATQLTDVPAEKKKLFSLVMDAFQALRRENKEVIWSSMVKDTIKRKKPQFSESYYGYRSFSNLLEDGEKFGLISLSTDPRSGTYVVSEPGTHAPIPSTPPASPSPTGGNGYTREERWSRRRGRGRGRWEERRTHGGEHAGDRPAPAEEPVSAEGVPAMDEDMPLAAVDAAEVMEAPASVPAHDAGDVAGDTEDEDGVDAPAEAGPAEETEEEVDETVSAASRSEDGDDRTPEERELDERAAALAHSRTVADSPAKTASGSTRKSGGRARTSRARTTRPRATAAKKSTTAAPRRRRTTSRKKKGE